MGGRGAEAPGATIHDAKQNNETNMSFILNEGGAKPPTDLMNRTPGALSTVTRGAQKVALLGEDVVTLTVESARPIEFEIGDQMAVFGRTYTLNRLPRVQKQGERLYTYEVELEGVQYDLLRVTYDLTIDTTSNTLQDVQSDALTGDLKRFATVLIANANRVLPGQWELGECPETAADRTLTFGETDNCLAVLQRLCKEFETEFEITQHQGVKTINLKKAGQTFPFTFRYGKGGGLYALERQNASSANIITRLKVYGSTRNITAGYRAQRLCLPGRKKGDSYIEKTDASWRFGIWEATKYFEDIYPKQKGKVTAVDAQSELKFTDKNMAFDLAEKVKKKGADGKEVEQTTYLLPGTAAKVHFNSGNLSGYEFEVAKYDHATRTFTLKAFKDERGETFPSKASAAFRIGVGDEYSLLDIAPPKAVVDEAERELQKAGEKYYDQNCKPKVQYGLTVAEDFLRSLSGIGSTANVFMPGDYIPVEDEALGVKHSVRVQSFTRDLLRPYSYSLTLSDTTTTSILNRIISDQIETDKIIRMNNIKDPATARANWRRSREVMAAVFDPEGNYYTAKIRPQSIDTVALSVGAKSMQFGLTNTVFEPNYGGNANVIRVQGGVLTHYTIDPDKARSWTLADGQATLDDPASPYYVYAKCQRAGAGGVIIFTKEQIRVDQDPAYYHFWIGILNSVDKEKKARAFAPMYGFTMINGRFIKTGRIQSADGETYFDLDAGEIGGNIKIKGNSDYATKTELKVLSDQIHGEVGQINTKLGGTKQQLDAFQAQVNQNVNNLISRANAADTNIYALKTAGFLTKDGVNAWWSAGLTEKGEQVASYISQSPTAIKMISEHLDINAIATFRSYKSAIGNIVSSNREGVEQNRTTAQNAQTAAQNAQTAAQKAAAAIANLGPWVNQRTIREALASETIIVGGYINTSLIDTNNLVVKRAAQIGGFYANNYDLEAKGTTDSGSSTRMAFSMRTGNASFSLSSQGTTEISGSYVHLIGAWGKRPVLHLSNYSRDREFSVAISGIGGESYERVRIKISHLPHKNTLRKEPNYSGTFRRLLLEEGSSLVCWE